MPTPIAIATWPFGLQAAKRALELLVAGQAPLDAAIAGAKLVEDDRAVRSVGFGSVPDRVGRLTLDSCVMVGKTLECGAVAGLEHIRNASAVAKRVMEKTPHVLLVGEGAKWFALEQGFKLEMPHTVESIQMWFDKRPGQKPLPGNLPQPGAPEQARVSSPDDINVPLNGADFGEWNHDTVTVLAANAKGELGGVCTTSGLAYKLPGRVGDSPLIGCGLYVDDEVGAAGATGVGEEVIRVGGAHLILNAMRQGKSVQDACVFACKVLHRAAARRGVHTAEVAFLALSPKGDIGAAATPGTNFEYGVARAGKVEQVKAVEVGAD